MRLRTASTGWATDPPIPFEELRKAKLDGAWVDDSVEGTTADKFAITDGAGHHMWAYRNSDTDDAYFQVFVETTNEPGAEAIREAISHAFGVEWISEHDPEFWEGEELEEEGEDEDELGLGPGLPDDDDDDDGGTGGGRSTVHFDLRAVAARMAGSDLSPTEKEEREVERLIHKRPPPSRKNRPKRGPKHDNRRRRMKVDDPDVKGGDPDMSLNRKTQGSIVSAAVRIVLAKSLEDLEGAISDFKDELHSVSPVLADDFAKYAERQHVEWVKEGWADEKAIGKEISEVASMSSKFEKLKKVLSGDLRRAGVEDIPEIVAQHWPPGPGGWAERGAVLDGLLSAIDSIRLPQAYKIPFLRGKPADALQDRKLLRKLIESSGSAVHSTEDDIFRFSQLAAAYQALQGNPESVDAESLRTGMGELAGKLDESSRELFELGEILDAWISTAKEFKPSKSRKPTFESSHDYSRVLKSLEEFFDSSDIVDPSATMGELEAYAKENFEALPPELEGMFEGFKRAAASNEPCGEAMSKRVATYHGVVDQRGNPVQTTNTGYKSFHSRNFTEENYKAILAYADALLDQPWLKYGWDGGSKDAQLRAALDLAVHMADGSLYQSKIDVDTYNLLYARLAKTGQDTFSETVIPVQGKVGQKRSARTMEEMRNRQEYQNIVRVASELRTKDPAAALAIIKNLRSLVSSEAGPADTIQAHVAIEETDAAPARTTQDLVGGCEAGSEEEETAQTMAQTMSEERVSQKPGENIEFRSMGDEDFKKLKDHLKPEIDKLFSEDDVEAFLQGFESILSDVEKKTASFLGDGVPLAVLVKLATASPEAKAILGPVIVAAKKKKDKKKTKKAPKKEKGKEKAEAAPPFGGKKAPPFGGKKKKASLSVEDADW